MKQHITSKQWDELDDKDKFLSAINSNVPAGYIEMSDSHYPNIGQMIEFLGDDWTEYLYKLKQDRIANDLNDPQFVLDPSEDHMPINKELVDALWEAVKHELK